MGPMVVGAGVVAILEWVVMWLREKDDQKRAELHKRILDSVRGLPDELSQVTRDVKALVEADERDAQRILEAVVQGLAALEPKTELDVGVPARTRAGRASPEFFRRVKDAPEGPSSVVPSGTVFQFPLRIANLGSLPTSIRRVILTVRVGDDELAMDKPYTGGIRSRGEPMVGYYPKPHLSPGEERYLRAGESTSMLVRMSTKANVPDDIESIRGSVTTEDARGLRAEVECIFSRRGG